jgi:hypothetical protein
VSRPDVTATLPGCSVGHVRRGDAERGRVVPVGEMMDPAVRRPGHDSGRHRRRRVGADQQRQAERRIREEALERDARVRQLERLELEANRGDAVDHEDAPERATDRRRLHRDQSDQALTLVQRDDAGTAGVSGHV